jgi:TonB family protein
MGLQGALLFFGLTSAVAPPPAPVLPPAGMTAPASVGVPHSCDENQYPVSALQTGTEGSTILRFTITRDGAVKAPTISQTSGNPDLDNAAIACASQWQYKPAMQNGVAVDAQHMAMVKWRIAVSEPFTTMDGEALRCIMASDEGRDAIRRVTLHPVVKVHFSNGAVAKSTLLATSGEPAFDQLVVGCYAALSRDATGMLTGEVDETFVAMLPQG